MGMDVYGKNPASKKGEYCRNNVWWWRPLWDYCLEVGDDIIPAAGAKRGHYNEGWGLNAAGAARLAERLRENIQSGLTKQYADAREKHLKSLPDEPCEICEGTGKRATPPKTGPGRETCNGCDGKGKKRPWDTEYPFEEKNVQEFADFLNDSGGFEIC